MTMAIVLIADIPGWELPETILIYAALILTVISLVDYLVQNKEVLEG